MKIQLTNKNLHLDDLPHMEPKLSMPQTKLCTRHISALPTPPDPFTGCSGRAVLLWLPHATASTSVASLEGCTQAAEETFPVGAQGQKCPGIDVATEGIL